MLSRRKFLTLLAAAPIVPYLAKEAVASPEIIGEAEFGFTWGNVTVFNNEFDKIIRETLRNRAPMVADNISRNNALLLKLTDKKAIKIKKISAEEQTKRMIDRISKKREKFDHDLRRDPYNTVQKVKGKVTIKDQDIFYEGYETLNVKHGV